ncbi:MAG TPA: hypothetical protein VJ323_20040 [Bryobacteraceae bacterium]|jgi:hypothetical protein|nr:hypothetical protein [Bryobacteraceae bacterium]
MIKDAALPFPEIANGFFRAFDNAMTCGDTTSMKNQFPNDNVEDLIELRAPDLDSRDASKRLIEFEVDAQIFLNDILRVLVFSPSSPP